ncbi:serine/threonine-protein kinase-like protein [Grosmannia clavigera kw1407]|uniref:non-specific serine/threonine protein kinase n=1 Tax=Grosmannia clavigera (strain kw1407 / UAMH 11150) TaxID=655863 RepID=F0XCD3_GROCL|nr:serine/threonine-protein kinase-like protein [Grosmannia clavigera kw1407]EFX03504.1 serine/threonine-protein kinase-like protein [Grosmannia clavigera kw1407]
MSHHLALFSLLPLNAAAAKVVKAKENIGIASILVVDGVRRHALDIGRTRTKLGDCGTLATLGRCGDVVVDEPYISRIQCSFEVNPSSKIVMFCDRSPSQTCEVFGDEVFSLDRGQGFRGARKVAVTRKINTIIGMGGTGGDLIKFRLVWRTQKDDGDQTLQLQIESHLRFDAALDQTIDVWDPATTLSNLPLPRQSRIRLCSPEGDSALGAGTFGSVHKKINVDTGNLLAVKYIQVPQTRDRKFIEHLEREVRVLAKLTHPHIVKFLGYNHQLVPHEQVQVMLELEDGTLQSLVERLVQSEDLEFGDGFLYLEDVVWETTLHHMLQALDFLASHKMIHRDVKPENILYTLRQPRSPFPSYKTQRPRPQDYHFRLGDLGLVNSQDYASTLAGTPLFMAPEMAQMFEKLQAGGRDRMQTPNMDVWSLFVSMLWVADLYTNSEQWFQKKLQAASRAGSHQVGRMVESLLPGNPENKAKKHLLSPSIEDVFDMAWADPRRRASAAQILVYRFEGKGLTTPLEQVPELVRMPPPQPPQPNPQAQARWPQHVSVSGRSNNPGNSQGTDEMELTLQLGYLTVGQFPDKKLENLPNERENLFRFR